MCKTRLTSVIAFLGWLLLSAGPAMAQSAGEYHYFYVDSSQHIEHLSLLGSTYGTWQDITSINRGPAVSSEGSIAGFADSLGDHVFYYGSNQHVYSLYYALQLRFLARGGGFDGFDWGRLSLWSKCFDSVLR
jgi:hypothetical protein